MDYEILNSKTLNKKLNTILRKNKMVSKSPYSFSFYNNREKTWGHTAPGTVRISDHWNFHSQGGIHCRTECGTTKGWHIGVYNSDTKTYTITPIFTPEEEAKEISIKERKEAKKTREREAKIAKHEKMLARVRKARKGTISYTVHSKVGRNLYSEDFTEVCELSDNGVWAFTPHGRKRVFEIVGVA